jgi:hypothetical protein
MKNIKKTEMDKLIFVCYRHGFGGENLSYRISNHALCDKLLVKTAKGRTVIKNDLFNKIFLGFNNNFQYNFQDKEKLCKKVIKDFKNKIDNIKKYNVVPSHIDAVILKKYFFNSYFIIINPPETEEQQQKYLQHLYDDFWLYKTTNLKEYIGEIYSKIEIFKKEKTKNEIKKITKEILSKYKNTLSFGQIQCVINDLEPSIKNMKTLFFSLYGNKEFNGYIKLKNNFNILNIPYKDVRNFSIENIFQHFKII